jgi:hypothetical protein
MFASDSDTGPVLDLGKPSLNAANISLITLNGEKYTSVVSLANIAIFIVY